MKSQIPTHFPSDFMVFQALIVLWEYPSDLHCLLQPIFNTWKQIQAAKNRLLNR